MSKKSFASCNTDEQKLRLRLKIRLRKLFRSWSSFRNMGGKERDHAYHWARMLRSLVVIEQILPLLKKTDRKRFYQVDKRVRKIKRKMGPYTAEWANITRNYGLKSEWIPIYKYRRTKRTFLKEI